MASISRSRRLPEPRSGGKILRPRRAAAPNTPYARPTPSRSPNWLSRFVLSPTRSIACGAGKLLSNVFDLDSDDDSSSSDDDDDHSSSEDEIGTANTEDGGDKDPQQVIWKSRNKRAIERLIMRETFSREECDRFIRIIRSRVVDTSANEDEWDMLNRSLALDSPELGSAAVMEAKKYLEEKKSRLDSNSELCFGSHNSDIITSPQALQDEGSPVDVAKSYMRSLPPWSSPSGDHSKPLTPIGFQLSREGTPYPVSGYSALSTKWKRNSPATGSWSIRDELRRVRSRATEQMLNSLPSPKIDLTVVESKKNVDPSAIENNADLEREGDDFHLESLQSDINAEQNQGSQTNLQQTEDSQDDWRGRTISGYNLRSSDGSITKRNGRMVGVNGKSIMNEVNSGTDSVKETRASVLKEKAGVDASPNGFPSSRPSNAGQGSKQKDKALDDKSDTVGSGDERISKVPDVTANNTVVAPNEDDGVALGSQDSSSLQNEFELEHSKVAPKMDTAVNKRSDAEKQKGRRISSRYNRSSGRGKGKVSK